MRPAFTCLLIGPPCLLGKIDRSYDRPSLTPNALRARHGSFSSSSSSSPLRLSVDVAPRIPLSFNESRIWPCRKRSYGHPILWYLDYRSLDPIDSVDRFLWDRFLLQFSIRGIDDDGRGELEDSSSWRGEKNCWRYLFDALYLIINFVPVFDARR